MHYGPFDRTLALLAEGRIVVDDLLGPTYPIAEAGAAFAEAGRDEARKVFIDPTGGAHVRDRYALAGVDGVDAVSLRRALDAIRHRGPDGDGVWLAPDRAVGIGHVRLSLVGLDDGAQPIASEDGQTVIAVNGEFYGHEAIRRDLEARGHRFRTQTDSEVALHLYEEHGLDFVHALRGEFALVLWDGRLGRLVAARDRFGIKPLCYTQEGGRLLVASEAKALFALGVRPAWDREVMYQVAGMQYPLPDRTLFAGIQTLRPGHLLIAAGGVVETRVYWDLNYPAGEADAADPRVPPRSCGRGWTRRCDCGSAPTSRCAATSAGASTRPPSRPWQRRMSVRSPASPLASTRPPMTSSVPPARSPGTSVRRSSRCQSRRPTS